ncbi:MAG: hypothetical protein ACKO4T_13450 [Planctomycetaceae bacterium]
MTSQPRDREPANAPLSRARVPVSLVAGRTEAVFTWVGDRWRHRVSIEGRLLGVSLEGAEDGRDAAWPASPPLVEISVATLPGGPAVLAVGQAGRSHYSASFTPHPLEPDTLLVDAACRVRDRPMWLGTTYAVGGETVRIDAGPLDAGSIAPAPGAAFPATIRWVYTLGPAGIRIVDHAARGRG